MHIRILHTNDIHSHFETYPKLATFLQGRDQELPSVLVDIGDNMDRFHSITEATNGRANTALLNYLQYDFATIGNNEGITLAHQELDDLFQEANFPILVANLFEQNGKHPAWIKPYVMKEIEGLKLCFIGVTVYYQKFYELLGWKLEDPFQILEKMLPTIESEADAIVVLSHLGITDDEEMARRFPGIDVILGGHTHHVLPDGKWMGDTLLCGAGKHGQYIGQVDLTFNQEKKLVQAAASLHNLQATDPCPKLQNTIEEMQKEATTVLRNKVATLRNPLTVHWFKDSPFPILLAEALKEWCDADIGMVNAGVLLESLDAGDVTREMLHRICPHPINPCRVVLTGDELKEVIQQAIQPEMEEFQVKGIGFRGQVMGKMAFSGLKFETESHSDGSVQIVAIFCREREILPHDTIAIGTIDMFTFGRMFPSIKRAKDKKFYMPELLRDVLADKLKRI